MQMKGTHDAARPLFTLRIYDPSLFIVFIKKRKRLQRRGSVDPQGINTWKGTLGGRR